jgi:hypothetical protein
MIFGGRERTKKTEELDKFWLRAFREYIKKNYYKYEFTLDQKMFWEEYFSEDNMPGKGKEFLSYGKRYKLFLFKNQIFAERFSEWFAIRGKEKLAEKRSPESFIFKEYYSYAKDELLTFARRILDNVISPLGSPSNSPPYSPPAESSYKDHDYLNSPMHIEEQILEYDMSPEFDFADAVLDVNR